MSANHKDPSEGIFKKSQASFLLWFFGIFLGTLVILSAFGLLPSELKEESNGNNFVEAGQHALDTLGEQADQAVADQNAKDAKNTNGAAAGAGATKGTANNSNYVAAIYPTRLLIPSISVDAPVDNPSSTSTDKLDYELTKGPVRYPGSGTVGAGNMFIFGHSTGWSIVQNKAYKVFNQIKTLKHGDVIYVQSGNGGGQTFEYRVREVNEVNKNDTLITFDTANNMLTLSTCDSFGAKTDRYVVTADFVGVK